MPRAWCVLTTPAFWYRPPVASSEQSTSEFGSTDALPSWAADALRSFRAARARDAHYHARLGGLWRFGEGELSFWCQHGPAQKNVSCLIALLWPVGLLVLGWAVAGLDDGAPDLVRFGVAAALLLAGTVAFTIAKLAMTLPADDGVLVAKDGLVVVEQGTYRPVDRARIEEIGVRDGALVISVREGDPLTVQRASDDEEQRERLADRAALLSSWQRNGLLPAPPPADRHEPSWPYAPWFWPASMTAGAAAIAALVYVTAVVPERSAAGHQVRSFVADLHAGDVDRAYGRLTRSYRREQLRAGFAESLPPSFLDATGYDVNGLGESACGGATRICVDGWLQNVDDSMYAFVLVSEDGELKIEGWAHSTCRTSWWH